MTTLTADEIILLAALVNYHQNQLRQMVTLGALTPAGRDQYLREINAANELRRKLYDLYPREAA